MYLKLLSDMYLKLFRDMYLKLLSDMYLKLFLCFGVTDLYLKLLKAILLDVRDMYLNAPEGCRQIHVP